MPLDISWSTRAKAGEEGCAGRISASYALMEAIQQGADLVDVLNLVADRSREIAGAPLAFVALPADANTLTVSLAVGTGADQALGLSFRIGSSVFGRVFTSRRAMASRVAGIPSRFLGGPGHTGLPAGPIMLMPLDTGEATRGVLAVAGRPTDLPLSNSLQRQLTLFATMSAALIELAEERRAVLPGVRPPWTMAAG